MRLSYLTILLVSIGTFSFAQIDSLKLAEQYYREGMEAFNFSHRKQAVDLFKLSVGANPKSVKANLMAAKSIMMTIHKEQSLPYFKKAYALDRNADEDILFFIGQAYHYNEQFDSALWYYEKFNSLLARSLQFSRVIKMNEVNWKIFECRNAQIFKANPVGVTIENLDQNINSEWPDYAPTISADESTMIFTTRRPDNNVNPSLAEDLEYYEEILISKRENGKWQPARKIDELNSSFHDASVSLSPNGIEMFVYSDENGGDIYETDLQADGTWSNPKRMNGFINSPYLENSAAISADDKKLFFVSDRPDGYGGTDIYVALRNKRGEWMEVLNLGPTINTPRDEEDVFASANGQHLYFSSNGHAGMGDLDIYRSEFDSATMKWSEPLNLGYPINSVENDIYFVMTGDEKYAYISSMRAESKGEQDIYKVDLTNWKPVSRERLERKEIEAVHEIVNASILSAAVPVVKEVEATAWRIHVREENQQTPLDARVWLVNEEKQEIELPRTGEGDYQSLIKQSTNAKFQLRAEAVGFEPYMSTIQLSGPVGSSVFEETIFLKKKSASPLSSLSLFYESNQITPQNQSTLDLVVALMKENKDLTIRISGHTDSNGEEAYNSFLSNRRAEESKKYLINAGISSSRIQLAAFGESKPLANNATIAGRKFNRRTEIEFVYH
jgi:outer membrane protein OmpA-like peptidoglycan-associated protein